VPFIRFLRDYQVKAAGGAAYSRGAVVECSEGTAGHFINRRAAELCEKPAPKPEPEEPAKPAPKQAVKAKVKKDADKDEAEG
jgi:outer membrane biosynthesis protein TonB